MGMELYVSNFSNRLAVHEYAIAKRFDRDRDGKLNEEERTKCLEALKSGFEKTLYWSEQSNDPTLNLRVIQKQGKIYLPDSILNQEQPTNEEVRKTKSKIDEQRKNQRIEENQR